MLEIIGAWIGAGLKKLLGNSGHAKRLPILQICSVGRVASFYINSPSVLSGKRSSTST
jgi:hypothetical protein